jgi:hypothetical protein
MLLRILYAIIVWVVVTIVLWLLGGLLQAVLEPTTRAIGNFLRGSAGLIGFLCAIVWYFFGPGSVRPRV